MIGSSLTKGLRVTGLISMLAARRRSGEEVAMGLALLDSSHKTGIKVPLMRTL